MAPRCPECDRRGDVERGDRIRATLTDRVYRVGRIDESEGTAAVFAPPEGDCRRFVVPLDELWADVERGRIEVVGRSSD
jgi:hypothetical protein